MAQRDVEPKEENAAELEFGKDLINCECLSTSQVAEFFARFEPELQEKRCAALGMPMPPARAAHVWAATSAVIRSRRASTSTECGNSKGKRKLI